METIDKEIRKKFNSTDVMRKIRDEISLEIMNMSYVEEKEYINELLKKGKAADKSVSKPSVPKKNDF